MAITTFENASQAQGCFKSLVDAAESGGAAIFPRNEERFVLLSASTLADITRSSLRISPEVYHEDDSVGLALPGAPFAVEGMDLDEAAQEMIVALREYADDWDTLRHVPNHTHLFHLVFFVISSTDEELKNWLTGAA